MQLQNILPSFPGESLQGPSPNIDMRIIEIAKSYPSIYQSPCKKGCLRVYWTISQTLSKEGINYSKMQVQKAWENRLCTNRIKKIRKNDKEKLAQIYSKHPKQWAEIARIFCKTYGNEIKHYSANTVKNFGNSEKGKQIIASQAATYLGKRNSHDASSNDKPNDAKKRKVAEVSRETSPINSFEETSQFVYPSDNETTSSSNDTYPRLSTSDAYSQEIVDSLNNEFSPEEIALYLSPEFHTVSDKDEASNWKYLPLKKEWAPIGNYTVVSSEPSPINSFEETSQFVYPSGNETTSSSNDTYPRLSTSDAYSQEIVDSLNNEFSPEEIALYLSPEFHTVSDKDEASNWKYLPLKKEWAPIGNYTV